MLKFVNFYKYYTGFLAVSIDNLILEPGIFWIKGVNGSGKSTLLKAIAGIISFDGDILLDNRLSIKKHAIAYRKLVNFADADPVFPEFLTGDELVELFASAKNAAKDQKNFYLESMKMTDYIEHPIKTYSSGMLKKLSLVLAFMGNPRIILLDEPLITLDSDSLNILYTWICQKFQQEGVSFLLSSHQAMKHDSFHEATELWVADKTLKL